MSPQPGARDGETPPVLERHSHPGHKPLAGPHQLLPALVCPHLTQSQRQQLSHSRGKIILSHKLALTAKILIDYQICVLQSSSLGAGQAVPQV